MSFVALFESIWNKPKVTKSRRKKKKHKMVNIYVSCFSLAASQFPRHVSKKASHLVKRHGTRWVTGTLAPAYLFIYYLSSLFIYTLFILVRLFQGPPWVPISVWGCSDPCVEEEGWDEPLGGGFEQLPWLGVWLYLASPWKCCNLVHLEVEKKWRHVAVLVELP